MTTPEIIMIVAIFSGPFAAVLVTEWMRRSHESRDRKVELFRDLMSTRAATLAPSHVEALNLIDIEFDSKNKSEKAVLEAWKLYHSHLGDRSYEDNEAWRKRTDHLFVDLLHAMSQCLNYPFDKAHIQNSSYYPRGYGEIELDQIKTRQGLADLLEGKSALNVISHIPDEQMKAITDAKNEKG